MASNQFTCQTCGTVFASRQERDQHEKREHATTYDSRWASTQQVEEGVNCPICGAQFPTSDQMNRHARQEHQR